jgi:tol-pal system protein YbgF
MRFPSRLLLTILPLLVAGLSPALAQMSSSDVAMRLDALENQIRQLTGQVEQLQFRNQQLEQQLKRTTEDYEFRFQELGGKGAPRAAQPQRAPAPQVAQPQPPIQQQPPADPRVVQRDPNNNPNFVATPNPGGRRGDAFDPNANPAAPGAPRALGALPPGQAPVPPRDADDQDDARGGREPGSPLDLSNVASDPGAQRRGQLPPPQQRNPGGPGSMAAVAPPGDSPRDYFDMGYGYFQRRDYANAEQTFKDFVQRFPSDRMAPEANYWLGESLFQRQRYQDAAEAYLIVTTKYGQTNRAPDALLRLGQSLAALGQKEMACASFAEIGRKYPNSSAGVKQGAEREQKRVRC